MIFLCNYYLRFGLFHTSRFLVSVDLVYYPLYSFNYSCVFFVSCVIVLFTTVSCCPSCYHFPDYLMYIYITIPDIPLSLFPNILYPLWRSVSWLPVKTFVFQFGPVFGSTLLKVYFCLNPAR